MKTQKIKTDAATINSILTRGVVDCIKRESLQKKLLDKRPLNIKFGIDPSGPDIHLGHAVPLRKLKQFQDAGHNVIIIIGDWTARIGDPTERNEMRPQLTPAQVKANAQKYLKQIFLILNKKKTKVVWQSKWFNKFNLQDVFNLLGKFTVSQLLTRDDFRERQKQNTEIGYHEPIYSLLQGYDSAMINADVEIGATEQLFNMMRGRDVQRIFNQPEQDILTNEILIGLDGTRKMGKSLNNYIALLDAPDDMYGKVMSIPDSLIMHYFELATDVSDKEVIAIRSHLEAHTENPRNIKMRLAREIVTLYHGAGKAATAEGRFVSQFQKKEAPTNVPEVKLKPWPSNAVDLLIATKLASSKTEARRIIEDGGMKVDGAVIKNPSAIVSAKPNGIMVSRGKRQFARVKKA